jgi:hypothetical protein
MLTMEPTIWSNNKSLWSSSEFHMPFLKIHFDMIVSSFSQHFKYLHCQEFYLASY